MKASATSSECPCGSGLCYASCCKPLHQGHLATTAEALMRSRYSAYMLRLEPYLLATWHPDTRPDTLDLSQDNMKWLGLKVIRAETTSPTTAIVEFIARYKIGGMRAERLHEISEFVYTDAWYYVVGKTD